ncbi:exodeoxyribonuclease V subunit alpha [Lysobacter brunescens]|uniref:RecBCD enzyme subunit RecD n=1 Tax=Lysobacter brunescens TaxID=262323 RepID=A0ABW2Y9U6_9GAMM
MNDRIREAHGDAERVHADAARALHRLQADGALRQVDADFAALLRDRLRASPAVALAGALAMRAVAAGHSSVALGDMHRLLDALGTSAQLPDLDEWRAVLQADACVSTDDAGHAGTLLDFSRDRIALRRYARYEQALADRLAARAAQRQEATADPPALRALLSRLFGRAAGDHAPPMLDRQALAVAMALRRRLLLVTGGPGTGKTTTVARLLVAVIEAARLRGAPPPRIALAAPTGEEAARLREAIAAVLRADLAAGRIDADTAAAVPTQARTLHRLLGWQPGRVAFRHHAGHPLREDLVVVDEASMVDLPLMAKLVEAVPASATLVLIGDPDQLPAVEAGDVLGGLCAASGDGLSLPADDAAFATALLGTDVSPAQADTGPLAGARVHLLHGWRQAGAAPLQALAGALQRGDRDAVLDVFAHGDEAVLSRRHGDGAALAEALRREALPAFAAVRDADDPGQALALAARCRILAALRRGPFGAEHWNAWCAAELGERTPYFHGRLLMIAANSERHGLYNGDLGVVWRDRHGDLAAWFETPQGLRAWRPAQLPVHASAYATTVHKAQGSEFDRVLLVLPDSDARVLSRELLYTALTRARRSVWIWGATETFERALERRTWRESGLEARLRRISASGECAVP